MQIPAINLSELFSKVWSTIKAIAWAVWITPFKIIHNLPWWAKAIILLILVSISMFFIIWYFKHKNEWKCV